MKKLLKSAKNISILTLISRILGLIRDIICASLFGASLFWDSFILSWTIPNLFRRLFGEGALSSAFIPVFAKVRKEKGLQKAFHFTNLCATYFGILLLIILVFFYILGGGIYFFSSSLSPKWSLFWQLSFILIPYLLLICLSALASGALNSLDEFSVPAFLPVLLNLFWIASLLSGIWIFSKAQKREILFWMSALLILGGLCQFLLVWIWLAKKGMVIRPSFHFQDLYLKETKKRIFPVLWSLALLQINVLLDRVIAEAFVPGNGAVSALYFGNRLIQFPLAMIGIALGTAVFPALSKEGIQKENSSFLPTFLWAMKIVFYIALPASIGMMVLSRPIVEILFRRGSFQDEASWRTMLVLIGYGPSVCFYSLVHILNRGFYAKGDAKTPAKIATYFVFLNIFLNLLLVFPLQEMGLALATSCCSFFNCLFLFHLFLKQYFRKESIPFFHIFQPKMVLSSLIMGAGLFFCLPFYSSISFLWLKILFLCASIALGIGIYLTISYFFSIPERKELYSIFYRKRKE